MQAQLTVTVSERAVAFRDLPLESFFIFRSPQGTTKIRRKVSRDTCCGVGRNSTRMLMRPSAMILPISLPETVSLAATDLHSGIAATGLLHSRNTRTRAQDTSRDPYQEWR